MNSRKIMAGIRGLEFDENSIVQIDHLFERNDWTSWIIFAPNEYDIKMEYFGVHWDTVSPEENWKFFTETFPVNHCTYGLANFHYLSPDNVIRTKTIFVLWAPDKSPVKEKLLCTMHYLDTKRQIETKGGIHFSIQANEYSDLDFDAIIKKIKQICYTF